MRKKKYLSMSENYKIRNSFCKTSLSLSILSFLWKHVFKILLLNVYSLWIGFHIYLFVEIHLVLMSFSNSMNVIEDGNIIKPSVLIDSSLMWYHLNESILFRNLNWDWIKRMENIET